MPLIDYVAAFALSRVPEAPSRPAPSPPRVSFVVDLPGPEAPPVPAKPPPSKECCNQCDGENCFCPPDSPCCVDKKSGKCVMATFNPPGWVDPHKVNPKPVKAAPAAPEWRVDNADGRYEVYGRLEPDGVFRWTDRRPRFVPVFAAPACANGRCGR